MTGSDGTLILTLLNEANGIRAFLDGLRAQTAIPREIVVVDGGSTDGTVALLQAWTPPPGCTLTVRVVPGANISEGRNAAIAAATCPVILVTDAGTTMDERWVERMLTALADPTVDVVSGFFYPVGDSFFQRTLAAAVTPRLSEIDPDRFLPSSRSVAFRKSAWERAGGYPEWLDYCEDLVFDLALLDADARFVFEPAAQVSWSARPTLAAFATQYYRYARGDGKADLWLRRHLIRYGAYALGLTLAAAAPRRPVALVGLVGGASLYMSKFWARVIARCDLVPGRLAAALALVPVLVVVGDVAKMAGYPVGVAWRLRERP